MEKIIILVIAIHGLWCDLRRFSSCSTLPVFLVGFHFFVVSWFWRFFLFVKVLFLILFLYTDIEGALCFLAVYISLQWSATVLPIAVRVLSKGAGLSAGPGSELAQPGPFPSSTLPYPVAPAAASQSNTYNRQQWLLRVVVVFSCPYLIITRTSLL